MYINLNEILKSQTTSVLPARFQNIEILPGEICPNLRENDKEEEEATAAETKTTYLIVNMLQKTF